MVSIRLFVFLPTLGSLFRTSLSWTVPETGQNPPPYCRRSFVSSAITTVGCLVSSTVSSPPAAHAEDAVLAPVQVVPEGDARPLFNEARALESQGNIPAANRLYSKVVKIAPRFIYGWSNLGNTQTVFGDLAGADESYSTAIALCRENLANVEPGLGVRRCSDLYLLLLNRGSLRLNNGRLQEALDDLQQSSVLRGRPDALVSQNLARAKELNGQYAGADREYTAAIAMTAGEVNPFWLRAALVKFQLGDVQGGFDLLKRVENRFPEAPEVRAAYACFLVAKGDMVKGQQKFLEIPDRARLKYSDDDYLTKTIAWPPKMRDELYKITKAVGDRK